MKMSSASSTGITPSATESATALATPCCAGPNICTACLAPLIVTLLNRIVLRLAQQVRRDDRQQRREAVLVVDQRIGEGELGRRAARTHDQVDMRNFIAVADQRLADQHLVDQSHVRFLPEFLAPDWRAL